MRILIIILFLIAIAALISRSRTLFVMDIENGELRVVNGDPPPRLVSDFRDAVRDVTRGTIKGRKSGDRLELSFGGQIDDGTAQRLRNILGVHQR